MADNARAEALGTLNRIFAGKQYSNIAVDTAIKNAKIDDKDRALYTRLVYGVIERKITLDYYIDSLSSIKTDKIEPEVRNILRMGLYQLNFLDKIPDHAAINESVELCRRSSKGFVNAILRNFLRKKDTLALPDREKDAVSYLSVKYSFGKEICAALCNAYGEDKTESILSAMCKKEGMTLRVNTLKTDAKALADELCTLGINTKGTRLEGGLWVADAPIQSLASFERGEFFVQDEASRLCCAVLGAKRGDVVIDVCSAPGSKSFGAAIDMENDGKIFAYDIHENKLSLINRSAKRLGIDIISTAAHDARAFISENEGVADKIICDVPCSGFGVAAKKPELRYKDPAESARLPEIQLAILENVSRYLKAGGALVYSTCTILPEENFGVVEKFLEKHVEFALSPFSVADIEAREGYVTLLPDEHGTDGFFICKIQKRT